MFSTLEFTKISLDGVFKRLALDSQNSTVVVTPNQRLSLVLKRKFNDAQRARALTSWNSANISPFHVFIERAYETASYSPQEMKLPILLSPTQERALWENIIRHSDVGVSLLSISETAQIVCEAWQIGHAWQLIDQLEEFYLSDDSKTFQDWAERYKRITRNNRQIDNARLYDLIGSLWETIEIKKPSCLICYGFDALTPQQQTLLIKIRIAGCEVMWTESQSQSQSQSQSKLYKNDIRRVSCIDSRDEIHLAAAWARTRAEANSAAKIGIVVPELTKHRSVVMRIFRSIMETNYSNMPVDTVEHTFPFNVSLGATLISYPLIKIAFLIFELIGKGTNFENASCLLRSPFLAGSESEIMNRALLDAQLRKIAEPFITIESLLVLINHKRGEESCPILAQQLFILSEFKKENLFGKKLPSDVARIIFEILRIIGFPGERILNSTEYQVLNKWHVVVANFAALDLVMSNVTYNEGVSYLRRIAIETLFQPRTPDVPIQILGILESAGMEFDHLWVMGLSDELWPPRPRPNPFLPIELQRIAKIPWRSVTESLEFALRLTNEWLVSGKEVILSYPSYNNRNEERKLTPSPLILKITESALTLPIYTDYSELIYSLRRFEYKEDYKAPMLSQVTEIRGGAAVIKDQMACPFRAMALHRLGAKGLETSHTGLNAMERGVLIHRVLADVWKQLQTKEALDMISHVDLEEIVLRAAKESITFIRSDRPATLLGYFAEIEQQRLARLTIEWLSTERKRKDFKVIVSEDKHCITLDRLLLTLRLDRVDQLIDGRKIIIDYKTGLLSISSILGDCLDEPQLPLYLVTTDSDVVAVAFAQIKIGKMRFIGLARDDDLLPDIQALSESRWHDLHSSWEELVAAWRTNLFRIAENFSDGNAQVAPNKYPQTCRNCNIKPLCRIHERFNSALVEQEDHE